VNNIEGIKVFKPDVFTDYRGDLWTLWKKDESPCLPEFNHDKVSTSRQNVLRGIHGDFKSHKLITCLYGSIYFVVVDNRKESPTFKQWSSMILDDKKRQQVLLPPGVGNGFLVLTQESVFHYKWSYEGENQYVADQFTLKLDDKSLNIEWPISNPILQLRDK
jgi:dTDP-4-dehydrorhamnose 3,5-epimerase